MDIEVRLLRSFVAIHEVGTITRAAQRLNCTQAALSMRLKMLETDLGASLFQRTPQGLQATPRGAEFYARALAVLAAYDEMLSATRASPAAERVRIGLPDDYALAWLGPALAALNLDRAEVEVTCDLSAHLVAGVERHDLDLALVTTEARPALTREEAQVQLHWLGRPAPGVLRLAAYPEGCVFRRAMVTALDQAARPWQVAVQSRGQAGIFAAVRAGAAVTVVAAGTAPADLLAMLDPPGLPRLPRVPLYLIARPGQSPAARRMQAGLARQVQDLACA